MYDNTCTFLIQKKVTIGKKTAKRYNILLHTLFYFSLYSTDTQLLEYTVVMNL